MLLYSILSIRKGIGNGVIVYSYHSKMSGQVSDAKPILTRISVVPKNSSHLSDSPTLMGAAYSTTPVGTKMVYERAVIMNLRNSPISNTPPNWKIPQSIAINHGSLQCIEKKHSPSKRICAEKRNADFFGQFADDAEQFDMEM
uniref:Uncharacterized protein n=1 Tax=Photinus pyralis TaxID=7054 RepID=A0A1Y1LXM9_PHOPY